MREGGFDVWFGGEESDELACWPKEAISGTADDGMEEGDEETGVPVGLVDEGEGRGVDVGGQIFAEVLNIVAENGGGHGFCSTGRRQRSDSGRDLAKNFGQA